MLTRRSGEEHPTGWRITRLADPRASARKVYTMWDNAVMVPGPELPATRDALVTALFGPAPPHP